jgi:hypothetical protein
MATETPNSFQDSPQAMTFPEGENKKPTSVEDDDEKEIKFWSTDQVWPKTIPEDILAKYHQSKKDDKTIFFTKDKPPKELFSQRKSDGAFQVKGSLTVERAEAMVDIAASQGGLVLEVRETKGMSAEKLRTFQKTLWMAGNSHEPTVDVAGFTPTKQDIAELVAKRQERGLRPDEPFFKSILTKLSDGEKDLFSKMSPQDKNALFVALGEMNPKPTSFRLTPYKNESISDCPALPGTGALVQKVPSDCVGQQNPYSPKFYVLTSDQIADMHIKPGQKVPLQQGGQDAKTGQNRGKGI